MDELMSFGQVLNEIEEGGHYCRTGWNGKDMWIRIQKPDEHSMITIPYIVIEYPVGHLAASHGMIAPWQPSNGDMFGKDWMRIG
jgi:hypothetical protein